MNNAVALIETLIVTAILGLLLALTMPALCRASYRAKAWIHGIWAFEENRIEAFLSDNEIRQLHFATNQLRPWNYNPYETIARGQ